jgi:hypothetical protein
VLFEARWFKLGFGYGIVVGQNALFGNRCHWRNTFANNGRFQLGICFGFLLLFLC